MQPFDCYQNERCQGESRAKTIHAADVDAFAAQPQRCC